MSARVPPHDLDAEGAVLSAVMLDRRALDLAMRDVKPEDFYSEANRRIFEAACELGARGTPVDLVTVTGALRDRGRLAQVGGAVYLAQIVDSVPAVAHVGTYARAIADKARVRKLIATCQRIAAEGYGEVPDAQAFIGAAERAVFELARAGRKRTAAHMQVVLHESYARMVAAEQRQGTVELPTGLIHLDRKIGGLGRARVTVVAARPGMGKTSLATGMAETVASISGPVAIFSMEMPREQLGTRMACCRAGASVFRALNGWLTPQEREDYLRASEELRKLPIWIDDAPGLTLLELRGRAHEYAVEAGGHLDLVVVDYLQLMQGTGERGVTRDRELSHITSGLKTLSKELNCAVVVLSQLNRECESEKDKRPRLSHLRESGGIEQDADDVVFVYRDGYYHAHSEAGDEAELIVAKQRNGPTGVVRVRFAGASTAFIDIDEDQAA